ncbi:DUF4382 domain-containing protein [Geobacter hydrogenophilus]|uniref:Lipoprotein n=1 Tax=Geobacter hydrogenophilus TaxID=40983 RepID=A0A9W6LCT4_9BACT|nr:DUF4382 domain-containing protein [Geobacter hydrogenophilus]MBT0895496.1 DUF4382 domain-containing protein [Geobacter hydrogenophilus]GLI38280.1 lipoprotein [Geobacter hydrogenophilus]
MVKRVKIIMKVLMTFVAWTLAVVQIQGCGGGGGGSSTTASTGTLKLSITDKQSDDFKSVVISIREIRVVPAGMENAADNDPGLPMIASFATPMVVDVVQLQFVQQALGEVVIPAGTYSQIRLILNPNQNGQPPANYLTLTSDLTNTHFPLKTPSGQQSGLKVLGPIEVKAGVINAVMIDFDPNTAIVARGNGDYNLKPTGIRLVRMPDGLTQFGSISGNVLSTSKEWTSVTVSVKRRGSINDTAPIAAGTIFSNYTSGAWQAPFAAFVPPSTATVAYKAFVAANGFQLYSSAAVPVATGQTTDLGDIHLTPTP